MFTAPMPNRRPKKGLIDFAKEIDRARPQVPPPAESRLMTVEEQIKAIAVGDFEAALKQADPDVEFEIFAPQGFPFIRRAKGIAGLRHAIEHNFNVVTDQQPSLLNVVTQGNVVVIFGTERGRLKESGEAYHMEFVHRFTFAGNSLKSIRVIAAHKQ